ncbi:MAG TPA: cytochrome c [Candidatus Binataceae bacterium]
MKALQSRAAVLAMVIGVLAPAHTALGQPASQLYLLNCWGCHRPNGEEIPGTAPSLKGAADFLRVPGGRAYLIRVPGVAESALDDAQVAAVMNWILNSFSKDRLAADFTPYDAAEIRKYRAERMLDVVGTRKALVAKMIALKVRSRDE